MRRYRANEKALRASKREATRLRVARHRGNGDLSTICELCEYDKTVDIHHEGETKEVHILCPNCHALITRGIKTFEEVKALHKGVTSSQAQGVTKALPNNVTPTVIPDKQEKLDELRQMVSCIEVKKVTPGVPLYDASVHRAGERVKVWNGGQYVETIIPELDAEGQPVPPGSISKGIQGQVSSNLSGNLKSMPKPEPKKRRK